MKEEALEDFDMVVGSTEEEDTPDTPDYLSPEWSDYVKTFFAEGEMVEEKPTVVGLRRVAELLLGPVVVSNCECVQSEFGYDQRTGKPNAFAVVKYTIEFSDFMGLGEYRQFTGLAEVNPVNTDDLFLGYPVATAESRAEGRAYKKALKLKGLTADEIPRDKDVKEAIQTIFGKDGEIDHSEQKISDRQKQLIERKCGDCNVDINKFINLSESGPFKSINEVSKEVASKMIGALNTYCNEPETIPKGILDEG